VNNYLFDIYRGGKRLGAIRATTAQMACLNYALLQPGITSNELEARVRESA
jgi:hypothetical protein